MIEYEIQEFAELSKNKDRLLGEEIRFRALQKKIKQEKKKAA